MCSLTVGWVKRSSSEAFEKLRLRKTDAKTLS